MLKPGDRAPDIALPDQRGKLFQLSALLGKRNAVLFFYPRANSGVCIMEACSFRDHYEEFAAEDTEVIGISNDGQDVQFRFAKRWKLPFTLLSDTDDVALHAFGVHKWMGLIRNRITFVIDKEGVVRAVIEGRFQAEHHVREALKAVSEESGV